MLTTTHAEHLRGLLRTHADPSVAVKTQRYFPDDVYALGVPNATVRELVAGHFRQAPASVTGRVDIAEDLLAAPQHHEEVLMAFAILHPVARTKLGEEFMPIITSWLERSVTNWAQCDDMCLKLLYPYLLGNLHLIPRTRDWVDSASPWARRAANVSVVKFVHRRVGTRLIELPLNHVFGNCITLLPDPHYYVQKGTGWLLKVTGQVHPRAVVDFVTTWHDQMNRDTFRYAIESLDPAIKTTLMALGKDQK